MVNDLLKKFPIISDQVNETELKVILSQLDNLLGENIYGDIVEMGCYFGTTSIFISRLLKLHNSDKEFHVYDSFEGLPEKTAKDNSPAGIQFISGELKASKKDFIANYKKSNLALPFIHKDWFDGLQHNDLPDKISFAFLDGDYYESIMSCFKLLDNKLSPGSVVIIDDYQNEALPGAKKAVDEWAAKNNFKFKVEQSLAIVKIPKQ